MKRLVAAVLSFVICNLSFIIFPFPVFAVTVTISNTPSTISDQPFNIDVSVSGAAAGTNYLRANLYPPSTTNYFGYTWNGANFYNGSDYAQYLPITIDSSGNFSTTMQAKLDISSSYYLGPGTYNLKVRRYTQSGSSYTWSNEASTTVSLPTPTPSPTPSTTPTPTPNPTSSPTSSSFILSADKSSINTSDSLTANIQITGLDSNTKYFLKGAFIKDGSQNYFGLTQVSGDWVKNNASYSDQFSITADFSGRWSGQLKVMADAEDSGFTGSGDYIFKVGRYTQSGSGPTWSNELTINITGNPQISQTSSTLSSISPSSSPKSQISHYSNKSSPPLNLQIATVAGIAINSSSEAIVASNNQQNTPPKTGFNWWFIGGGLVLIAGFGTFIFLHLKQRGIIIPWFSIPNLLRKHKNLPEN